MKQVFIKKGKVIIEDTPLPQIDDNSALIKVTHSVISVGTEMTSVVRSKQDSLTQRIVKQPKKIFKAVDMAKNRGLIKTFKTIHEMHKKLDQAIATESGYSCSGIVVQVGKNILNLRPGDHVACGGLGKAVHAEVVSVPVNLIVKIPEGVSLKDGASATIGSIAMQGVRRADVRIGEYVSVIGMGLIGQITAQILSASGCRVFGIDLIDDKLKIASEKGIYHTINALNYDSVKEVMMRTNDKGVDTTIITAASTSDEIVQQAMEMTRKKGVVVVVGAVGLGLQRAPFYKKEIDFKISCSYGPGRYDEIYEEKGIDYPYGYVRWTENRNMEEYLRLIGENKIAFSSLISSERSVEEVSDVYEELQLPDNNKLGVILKYDFDESLIDKSTERKTTYQVKKSNIIGKISVGVIGAGGFAKGVHLPNLQALSDYYDIHAIAGRKGGNAKETAKLFNAEYATTDYQLVIQDPDIDMVIIATRHDLHAQMAIEAAQAGKAVILEKPMAMNMKELNRIEKILKDTNVPFMVGFNRRFSPCSVKAKEIIGVSLNPILVMYRVNARHIPLDHWVHGPEGGGRIIGEACHMIDLFSFFTESNIASMDVSSLDSKSESVISGDNMVATLKYKNGSVCTLMYTSQGATDFGKEYIEIYADQKTIVIDDFKSITAYGTKFDNISYDKIEKGQLQELEAFAKSIKDNQKTLPISIESLIETTSISFSINEMLR